MDLRTLLDIQNFGSVAEGLCVYVFYYQEFPFELAIVLFNTDIIILDLTSSSLDITFSRLMDRV